MPEELTYTLSSPEFDDTYGGSGLGTSNNRPLLAWLSPPNEKNEVYGVSALHICKAYLHDMVQDCILGRRKYDVSLDRIRLAASLSGSMDNESEEELEKAYKKLENFRNQAQKTVNLFEKLAKWKRTHVIPLKMSKKVISHMESLKWKFNEKYGIFTYKSMYTKSITWVGLTCFQGSGKWMSTPHTISMYTLLIRTSFIDFGKFDNIPELVKAWEKYYSSPKIYNGCDSDTGYMRKAYPMMHEFIAHRKEIYKDRTDKSIWKICEHNTGIANLCDFNDADKAASSRFSKIMGG